MAAAALIEIDLCLNTAGFDDADDRVKLHSEGLTNLRILNRFSDKDLRTMSTNLGKRTTVATRLLVGTGFKT
jgi:hypothetical protein